MRDEVKDRIRAAIAGGRHAVVTKYGRWIGDYPTYAGAWEAMLDDEGAHAHTIYSPPGEPKEQTP